MSDRWTFATTPIPQFFGGVSSGQAFRRFSKDYVPEITERLLSSTTDQDPGVNSKNAER